MIITAPDGLKDIHFQTCAVLVGLILGIAIGRLVEITIYFARFLLDCCCNKSKCTQTTITGGFSIIDAKHKRGNRGLTAGYVFCSQYLIHAKSKEPISHTVGYTVDRLYS